MIGDIIKKVLLGTLFVLALGFFVCFTTFHVTNVQIRGSKYFDANQLAEDVVNKNWMTQNSLYLLWKYRNGIVDENTPYLRAMEVKLVAPSTVEFTIFEKPLVGCFSFRGKYYYFDSDGIILKVSQKKVDKVPMVRGLSVKDVQLYEPIPSDNLLSFDRLLDITQILEGQGLEADRITFGNNGTITLKLGEIRAALGSYSNLDAKIETLVSILPYLGQKTGTLHLESITATGQMATFKEEVFDDEDEEEFNSVEEDGEEEPETGEEDLELSTEPETTETPAAQTESETESP